MDGGRMDTLQVPVSEETRQFLESQARAQGHRDPAEFVTALIEEAQRQYQRKALEGLLRQRVEGGRAEPAIEVNQEDRELLRRQYREQVQ
jgi:hypothetical protein